MTNTIAPSGLSRRQFLLTAGVTATAMVASSGSSPVTRFLPGTRRPLRLGLLLPERAFYPHLADSLLSGLQFHFTGSGSRTSLHLFTERVGQRSTIAATHRLLDEGVDLLAGVLNADLARSLHPLLAERKTPLIVTGAGANLPHNDTPFLFHNTLALWQTNYALGRWAVANLGTRAIVAASAYDSGFDAFSAFADGFSAAGGEIKATYVTHRPIEEANGLERVLNEIEGNSADLVAAFYCGDQAGEFLRAYREKGFATRLPLVGSAFLVEDELLAANAGAALDVYTASSWSPALELEENQKFQRQYRRQVGRPVDAFSLLGYETARLLEQAVVESGSVSGNHLRPALAAAVQNSPRGPWQVEKGTQQASTPLYLRRVQRGRHGLHNAVLSTLPAVTLPAPPAFKTGWLQPYLAI